MRAERQRPPEANRRPSNLSVGDTQSVRRNAVLLVDDEALTIKGSGIFEALRPHGYRCVYGGTIGGWYLPRFRRGVDRTADVLAALENAGYRVRVIEAEPWGAA